MRGWRYFSVCLVILLLVTHFYPEKELIIKQSPINGYGLFANRSFRKGDIIIQDLFPHKEKQRVLRNPPTLDFHQIISYEGRYINHCSTNYNSTVISKKNQLFKLIATKNIHSGQEITANYETVSRRYPFIASSESSYSQC